MTGYTKLFSSIVTSTIWQEPAPTKVVWITLLALSDKDGVVEGSVPGLAHVASVSIDDCEAALAKLQMPDRYSRSPEHEGRRIQPIDGGWLILNREKYRDKWSEEDRKEYKRRWMQKKRESEKRQPADGGVDANVDSSVHASPQVDAVDADKDIDKDIGKTGKNHSTANAVPDPVTHSKRGTRIPNTFAATPEHVAFAAKYKLPDPREHVEAFKDYWRAQPGGKGIKLDWDATFRNWLRRTAAYGGSKGRRPSPEPDFEHIDYSAGLEKNADGSYRI